MLFSELESSLDVSINLGFVIPIVGEGGVDLAQGKVRILEVKFGGTPAIGEIGGDEFNHFHGASGDARNLVFPDRDVFVFGGFDRKFYHGVISNEVFLF